MLLFNIVQLGTFKDKGGGGGGGGGAHFSFCNVQYLFSLNHDSILLSWHWTKFLLTQRISTESENVSFIDDITILT